MPRKEIALFMEMRLGKTHVATRWASQPAIKRVLVLAPLPVVRVWREELLSEEWAEEDIQVIKGNLIQRLERARTPGFRWYLTNYECIRNTQAILREHWDCVILDESTKIRNPQAQITKVLMDYAGDFEYKATLSGFPTPEGPWDLFEQARFLKGSFLGCKNFWVFRNIHFFQIGYTWIIPKRSKIKIAEWLQREAFCMTRKEAGLQETKIYQKRYVEMNTKQKKINKMILDGFEYKYKGEEKQTKWAPTRYVWWAIVAGGFTPDGQLLNNAKFVEILSLLKGELKGQPIVIWFRFTHELLYAFKYLKNSKIKVGVFYGADKRDAKSFEDGKLQVICAQSKCGQFGLNWSRSSTTIYYSNWPDGEVRVQCEDRTVHPQKKDPLLYIDMVAEDSLDEDMVALVKKKRRNGMRLKERALMQELTHRWEKRITSQSTPARQVRVGRSGTKTGR